MKCKALMIGGSAGSLDVILGMLPTLKTDLHFPVIIVMHRKNSGDSMLSELLSYKTKIIVKDVEDKEPIQAGVIYVAPADYHLLIENEQEFSLDASEKINYSRPSIDVSFESAAEIYKETLVCVLLSGANADGVKGLRKVRNNGGLSVVQTPRSAIVPFMPEQAIQDKQADIILNGDEIADFINDLK